jgi:uncharacterized SAM-binding protein YcdF (DUF218 family)
MNTYILRDVLRELVLPPGGPLLLMVAGCWCLWRGRQVGRVLVGAGVLSLWLLATPAVADGLEWAVERYPALDLGVATGAEAVVILSAGARRGAPEYGSDAPDWETLQRLAYGALVARRTALPVLVSGGLMRDMHRSLAAVMRESLERDFVLPVRWLEQRSRDTHENALYSAELLRAAGVRKIILVSSANHLWRAVAEFEATGLAVVPAPVGGLGEDHTDFRRWIASSTALARSKWALYEALGELVRRIRVALA